jgi:F-type H+-transporting ATPase subunit b
MISLLDVAIPIAHAAEEVAQTSGPVAVLGLNLKLFIAQLVNFGIVLFILWKWVFTPVAKKLQERTDRIEKAMADAHTTEKEKQEFAQWKETEMVKVRSQSSAIITAAESQAVQAKDSVLKQTKADQEKLVEQAKKQIEQEKNLAMQSAKSELADIVTQAAEKILRKKLDEKGDKELIKESFKNI